MRFDGTSEGFLALEKFLHSEVQSKHNCKVKQYPNGKFHITCFSRDIFRDDTWELLDDSVDDIEKREYCLSDPREDNLRRAKAKIFDIALSNDWSYMITLTLDGSKIDRYDPKEIIRPFSKWLNNMVTRKDLKYLIVPELHEDGAIHFHGLINDTLDLVDSGTVKVPHRKKPIQRATAVKYGYDLSDPNVRTVFNIKNYHLGFSSAVKIDNNVESVSKYMTKYTCKNFQKIFGQSFFAGGDINRSLPCFNLDMNYHKFQGDEYVLPNNLGSVKYLLVDANTFNDLVSEWSY